MMIAFPHMGNLHIVLKELLGGFGCKVMAPPPISKRTLELGVKYSPETVCLPFKLTLGNFIEALEQGADTIITCGGVGPCRLGYYAAVQKGILERLGYEFRLITVEPDLFDVIRNLRQVASGQSWRQIYYAFQQAGAKMSAMDHIEQQLNRVRPRAVEAGQAEIVWQQAVKSIDAARTVADARAAEKDAVDRLQALPLKSGVKPLKVGLVGEIYVMLEPFINQDLERRLSEMGVEVEKTMYLSQYVQAHLLRKRSYMAMYKVLFALAKPYLGHYVGGHGLKSIARTVQMGQAGYDGVIQAYPFTCMPEVIAKNILPQVSRDLDIPVLTLAYDEQSGEAGIMTRLEAFVDLLKYRRQRKDTGRQSI